MFRKDPQIKALSNLKSSERRRMLTTLTAQYDLPTGLSKESEELILPSTIKQTTFINNKGISGTIYTDNDQTPLYFKSKHSDKLIPTLFTLWRAPFILPLIQTYPHVLEVLEGGADLMLPGTVPPFPQSALPGAIVGVVSTSNPTVVRAVGKVMVKMAGLERTIGMKGVAVEVYHTYEDMLYGMNKVKTVLPESVTVELTFKEEEVEQQEQEQEKIEIIEDKEEVKEEDKEDAKEDQDQDINELTDAVDSLTTDDIDHFFKRSLFQTLTQSPSLEFPLLASSFMNHIVNNLPTDHNSVQIKKTSWKKSAKFLKTMEKEGFLKLKGKGDDITVVSSANKDNNDHLKNFVPYKIKSKGNKTGTTSSTTDSKGSASSSQLVLTQYYKPTSTLRLLFNDLNLDYLKFYTSNEVREIINNYISKHNLVNQKNKKNVLLDDVLFGIIGGKGIENSVGRDKIMDPFIKKFAEHYQITNPSDPSSSFNKSAPKRGQVPQVKIITETKIGRKLITRVSDFESFGINAEELSSELKVKCSGSSTIGQNVQNPKLVEVTVQGPHGKVVTDLLTKKYGLHPNWIGFEDKSKSKKKK